MNELPKIVRVRLSASQGGDHPDPDQLTAFAEQALAGAEKSRVLVHLAQCADCRDVLALATTSRPAEDLQKGAAVSIDTGYRFQWLRSSTLRWGALAACIVIVGSAVLMNRDVFMSRQKATTTVYSDAASPQAQAQAETALPPLVDSQSKQTSAKKDLVVNKNEEPPALKTSRKPAPAQRVDLPAAAPPPSRQVLAEGLRGKAAPMSAGAAAGSLGGTLVSKTAAPPQSPVSASLADEKKAAEANAPSPALEAVEVTGAAPTVQADVVARENSRDKEETPGKAKVPAGAAAYDTLMSNAVESPGQDPVSKDLAKRAEMKRATAFHTLVARWTISSDGQLQHSVDSGKTWQPVVVAEHASFRALSANGPDIWVGGAAGLLYHSSDAGSHWAQVQPVSGGGRLSADIAAIEFANVLQGKVTTSTAEVWVTEDGGQTWHKQP